MENCGNNFKHIMNRTILRLELKTGLKTNFNLRPKTHRTFMDNQLKLKCFKDNN